MSTRFGTQCRRGSLLVVTLWLIAILATIAVALGGYLSTETRLLRYHIAHARAHALARAGVYLALQRLAEDAQQQGEEYDWLGDKWAYFPSRDPNAASTSWHVSFPDQAGLTITMTDEERKLNVNRVGEIELAGLFEKLLGGPAPVDLIADAVDADTTPRPNGLEASSSTPPYQAKNAPLVVLEEAREIPGVTDETSGLLQRFTSPFLELTSSVNINTASPELLRAMCAVAEKSGLAEQIVAYRWKPEDQSDVTTGNRFVRLTPDVEVSVSSQPLDPTLKDALTEAMVGPRPLRTLLGVQAAHFKIVAMGETATPAVRSRIQAVVRRGASSGQPSLSVGGETFTLLAWQEG